MTSTGTLVTLAGALVSVASLHGCAPSKLSPPAAPSHRVPELPIDPGPIGQNNGRVILDAVDGRTRVEEVIEDTQGSAVVGSSYAFTSARATRPVCTTPCAADLPLGSHRLRFTLDSDDGVERSHEADVAFGSNQSIYRVALRAEKPSNVGVNVAGMITGILGGTAMAAGAGGMLASLGSKDADDRARYQTAGAGLLAGGAALLTLGIVLIATNRGTVREARDIQFPFDTRSESSVASTAGR